MLCVVIYLYAVALVLWVLNVVTLYRALHTLLMDKSNIPLPDRVALADEINGGFWGPMEALFVFNVRQSIFTTKVSSSYVQMIVGDSVLMWRTWVIYFRTRWVLWFPGVMLLTSFGKLSSRLSYRYHLRDRL
jgi:hypothetical protein